MKEKISKERFDSLKDNVWDYNEYMDCGCENRKIFVLNDESQTNGVKRNRYTLRCTECNAESLPVTTEEWTEIDQSGKVFHLGSIIQDGIKKVFIIEDEEDD